LPIVLVADDEALVRKLVCQMLQKAGYDVVQAEDGLAAYNRVRELNGALDVVITDIVMPRMNGAQLVSLLREEYPHIKLLCVSAYADPMSPNGHYFLAKPFTGTALIAILEKVFGVHGAEQPSSPQPTPPPATTPRSPDVDP
jgi:CheY-like chemotaxis protein